MLACLPIRRTALACAPFAATYLDETDFRADPQSAVGPIEHRIAVKIDFATVGRFDEAALVRRQKLCHPTVTGRAVLAGQARNKMGQTVRSA
jgi:hypothetical protein